MPSPVGIVDGGVRCVVVCAGVFVSSVSVGYCPSEGRWGGARSSACVGWWCSWQVVET